MCDPRSPRLRWSYWSAEYAQVLHGWCLFEIVLAGIGATEFQSHSLWTSLLACNTAWSYLWGKYWPWFVFTVIIIHLFELYCHALGFERRVTSTYLTAAWVSLMEGTQLMHCWVNCPFIGIKLCGRCCSLLFSYLKSITETTYLAHELGAYLPQPSQESYLLQRRLSQYANNPLKRTLGTKRMAVVIGGMASLRFWRRICRCYWW